MPHVSRDLLSTLHVLLDEALDLAPLERETWLRRLRQERPAEAEELERLLSREAGLDAEGFLTSRSAASRGAAGLQGRSVGPWTLERPLGQGGMGTVWLARRNDGRFEGTAAVKLLNLALIDPVGAARFHLEGSVLARLNHPHIARLLDAGVTGDGQPFLVLEHVEGTRIDRYADEHRLSPEARLRLFLDVLGAVAHAHANLVVHRDLKPSNILVADDGTVKLLDFGIAKLLEQETAGGEASTLTDLGGRVLTPEYAAPEQVTGDAVTTATDVYALGVLLYLLLAGRHPTAERGQTAAEHFRGILETEPPRLSAAATQVALPGMASERLRRRYAGDLENIVAKALKKRPSERYATVGALADDLRRYLAHEPVQARPDTLSYRAGKFVRRNRTAVSVGVMVVLALLTAVAVTTRQMLEARRQRDAAVRESQRADAQVEFQNVLLSHIGDRPITMREVLDAGREVLERQALADPRLRAALLHQLSENYRELGDQAARAVLLARADSIARVVGDSARLADVACDRADVHRKERRFEDAWRVLREAEPLARASGDLGVQAGCAATRSIVADDEGRSEDALRAAREAVALRDRLGSGRSATLSSPLDQLAILAAALESADRPREAAEIYRRVLAAMDSSGRGGMLSRAITYHNLAIVLGRLGERADAERGFHEVMERFARNDRSGQVHLLVVTRYAEAALAQGRADSAVKYFDLVHRQARADASPYWERRSLYGLAQAQVRAGRVEAARAAHRRLVELHGADIPLRPTEDLIPDPRLLAASIALANGDTAAADAQLVRVLRELGFFDGREQRRLRPVALQAGECALALGRPAEALDLARRARTIAAVDSLAATRSAAVGEAQLLEARALLALGDATAAEEAARRALGALRIGAGPAHAQTAQADSLLRRIRGAA